MISNVMMTLIEKLAADGQISQSETVDVRRAIFPDGAVSRAEAEALFALNDRVGDKDPAWNACFIEAICDHLLLAEAPQGHVSNEGAGWLETRIANDGKAERPTEVELVLALMEKADSCPASIHELAHRMVSHVILSDAGKRAPGQIGEAELALIRRTLFAVGGAGNVAVTRAEAEWLFEIDTATEGRAHVAGWRDLFVSAIMNHLFAAGPSHLLDRDNMMKRAQWLSAPTGGIGGFLARAVSGGVNGYAENVNQKNERDGQFGQVKQREVEAQVAEALETHEAAWLVTRIRADGRRTANEQAVIDAVKVAKGDEVLKSA